MKNKVIIFEGLNNTLKTTIINNFMSKTSDNFHILHYGKPPKIDNVIQYQEQQYVEMFQLLDTPNFNFILDRSHLGECVWAPVYREYDNSDKILQLEENFLNRTNKDVFLFTLIDSEFERYMKRDDKLSFHDGDKERHNDEIEYFTNIHNRSNIENKWIIDLKYFYLSPESDHLADLAMLEYIQKNLGIHLPEESHDRQYST